MRKKSNMSLLTNHVLSGVALIAGLGLTASHAYAQHGTFNLPFEAHWGSVALPLGPCRISVPKRMSLPRIIEISSNGRTVSIMAGFEALQPQSDHCYLSLLNIDGTYVVREFNSGA